MASLFVLAVSLSSGVLLMLKLFGNLLVCFVIIRNRIMRTPLNYLLLNLAATDMLIGVCSLLSNMFSIIFHEAESYTAKFLLCKLLGQGTILSPCYYTSSLNLAGIAYESYQAVVKPLTVKEKITKRKTVIFITVLWVLAPVETCILSFQADLDGNVSPTCVNNGNKRLLIADYILSTLVLGFTVIAVVLLYGRIIWEILQRDTQVLRQQQQAVFKAKKKIIAMLITISVISVVPWGLGSILLSKHGYQLNHWSTTVAILAVHISSSINWVLYASFSERFRRHLMKALCCSYTRQFVNAAVM